MARSMSLWEVDLEPRRAGHIGDLEQMRAFEQQVAHRFFVRHVGAAAIDIAGDDGGQTACRFLDEGGKSRPIRR